MSFDLFDHCPTLIGSLMQDDGLKTDSFNEARHRFAHRFIMTVNHKNFARDRRRACSTRWRQFAFLRKLFLKGLHCLFQQRNRLCF